MGHRQAAALLVGLLYLVYITSYSDCIAFLMPHRFELK